MDTLKDLIEEMVMDLQCRLCKDKIKRNTMRVRIQVNESYYGIAFVLIFRPSSTYGEGLLGLDGSKTR